MENDLSLFKIVPSPIHEAASANDLATVRRLVEEEGVYPSLRHKQRGESTPLHAAARRESLEVATYLLGTCRAVCV